jgi:hypothetical protein
VKIRGFIVKRLFPSKRHIFGAITISALAAAIATPLIMAHTAFFHLEVALRSSQPGEAQLYYETGTGINEAESRRVTVKGGDSMQVIRFPLPSALYGQFRLDPIDRGLCEVSIRDARIVDAFGHVLKQFPPEEFGDFHDISSRAISNGEIHMTLSSIEEDPSLTTILEPPLRLRSSATVVWGSAIGIFLLCFLLSGVAVASWFAFVPRERTAQIALLLGLLALGYVGLRARFLALIGFDEEIFLWQGSLVQQGQIPYRDFFEAKPPIIFFANAIGLTLFGLDNLLFRIVPSATALVSLVAFYFAVIRRRVVPWLAALLTAQIALWLLGSDFHDYSLNDSETYGVAFTLLGFSLGSHATRSGKVSWQIASGMCFGLAVLSKELFVLSVLPAWLLTQSTEETEKWRWRPLLFSAAGGITIGLSFLIYLTINSALIPYFDILRYAKTFAAGYCVDMGRFPEISGWASILQSWERLHAQLYDVKHLAFVLPLWLALPLALRSRPKAIITLWMVAFAGVLLGMIAVSVGHCFWKHYFLMGTIGVLLPAVLGAEAVTRYLSTRRSAITAMFCSSLCGLFFFVALPPVRTMLAVTGFPRVVLWDPVVADTIEKHSKPGDYILAPEGPLIYVVTKRKNPLFVVNPPDTLLPYLKDADPRLQIDSLQAELERNLPKVCYFAGWMRPNQEMWHQLLFDPILVKHGYVRVNDGLWYLPDEK